jgi:hypothetical protein
LLPDSLLDQGHEVIIFAVRGWHPNKTAVEDMATKLEKSLKLLTANNMIILHLFDNISYMVRSEKEGHLPIRKYGNGEFHVESGLFFRNVMPLLRLLQGLKVIFLTPLPRFFQESC